MGDNHLSIVCRELDDMAIRMLRLMKEYIDAKIALEELIKSGSLHLAKSRYIMGNKSVSILQLPTEESSEFTASTRVTKSNENNVEDQICFKLSKITLKDVTESASKLRSRNPKNKNIHSDEQDDVDCEISIPDPLKWFGVLVPQNMRQAQASFSKALEYVIQCTNIQIEMDHLKKEYNLKIKEKEEFKLKNKS